jgi:hypothetical protein
MRGAETQELQRIKDFIKLFMCSAVVIGVEGRGKMIDGDDSDPRNLRPPGWGRRAQEMVRVRVALGRVILAAK